MKILGISANNYHDSSACLVIDGEVIASSSEERFTFQKHDPNFPTNSINYCLKQGNITSDQLDLVAFHEVPEVKLTRSLSAAFMNYPSSLKIFNQSMREAINSSFFFRKKVSENLVFNPQKICFTPHHISHAAHSFLTSPFETAAVLTVDGVGEWMSGGIFYGDRRQAQPLKPLHLIPFPHSIGIAYAAFTGFLGFKVNDSECSTMALAAFGRPTYYEEVKKIIQPHSDDTYELDLTYFNFVNPHELPITEKFKKIFGAPRSHSKTINFDSMLDGFQNNISVDEQRYADIACSIQIVLEEYLIKIARKVKILTGSENLCFSGGVALNCVANSKLIQSKVFEKVFIPVDPGDGGGAMGSALYTSFLKNPNTQQIPKLVHPYFGADICAEEAIKTIGGMNINKLTLKHYKLDSELTAHAAKLLYENKILGWAQGRAENGPRALGARSILIRPDNIGLAKKLSRLVKSRASFRPYACSLTDKEAFNLFEAELVDCPHKIQQLKWMQVSALVKESHRTRMRATLHVDYTTRPQICTPEDNQKFYSLLSDFGKLSGTAALLNTSFNMSGFPLVNNSLEALLMFMSTEMDALVIDNYVIEKII